MDIQVTLPFSGCIVVPHNNELFFCMYIDLLDVFLVKYSFVSLAHLSILIYLLLAVPGHRALCRLFVTGGGCSSYSAGLLAVVGGIFCCGARALGYVGFSGLEPVGSVETQ